MRDVAAGAMGAAAAAGAMGAGRPEETRSLLSVPCLAGRFIGGPSSVWESRAEGSGASNSETLLGWLGFALLELLVDEDSGCVSGPIMSIAKALIFAAHAGMLFARVARIT